MQRNYTTGGNEWLRVTAQHPCPVCNKPDWCCIASDGSAALCQRVESSNQRGDAGWLHRLTDDIGDGNALPLEHRDWLKRERQQSREAANSLEPAHDWPELAARYFVAAKEKQQLLADDLGVSAESLNLLFCGWDGSAWTFPEWDGSGNIIGISRRLPDGVKRMMTGSRRGLMYSTDWVTASNDWHSEDGPVLLVEGASDTATGLTLGICTVGRPSNTGGVDHLAMLLAGLQEDRPIIVLGELDPKDDGSWPGKTGAISTAEQLAERLNRPVAWALPPDGAKDLRSWLQTHKGCPDDFVSLLKLQTVDPPAACPAAHAEMLPAPRASFPVDSLPQPLATYVERAAAAIGCDASMIGLPLLSVLAGAIGNTRRIRLKQTWSEPAVVWAAIVSPSGTQKSPALDAAVSFLQARQDTAIQQHSLAMEQFRDEREQYETAKRSRNNTGGLPDRPQEPICTRYIVQDTTIPALADRLVENPRGLLLFRDELSGWLRGFNEFKGGKGSDDAHMLTMHGARSLTMDRRTGEQKTLHVPHAAVSVAGGIQPETLRACLGREHFENGLAGRLLLTMPDVRPKRWKDDDLTEEDLEPMARLFDQLLSLECDTGPDGKPVPRLLTMTGDGRAAWIDFYNSHNEEQADLAGDLRAAWSKLEGYVARLGLVVHLVRWAAGCPALRNAEWIDDASILAAIDLVRWCGAETRRVYSALSETEAERDQRELLALIHQRGGQITARDLVQGSRKYRPTEVAEAALQKLVSAGFGQWKVTATGGRPRREFVLSTASTST